MTNLTPRLPSLVGEIERLNANFEGHPAEEVLRWGFATFPGEIALACSFGGPTGLVLLDLAARIEPNVEVFYADTGLLFPETYALIEEVGRRYRLRPVALQPDVTLDEQAAHFGEALWQLNPDQCCQLRKVEPTARFLATRRAWIAGLRRDQASTRRQIGVVEWDDRLGLVKLNPLASWSEEQVWAYLRVHELPYNPLHDRGYPSLGCVHCTRPVVAGEDRRAGRWAGVGKTECGLHYPTMNKVPHPPAPSPPRGEGVAEGRG